jgi:hypothetical protein
VIRRRLSSWGALVLTVLVTSFWAQPTASQTKSVSGKLAGVVRDTSGIPQLGASVELISESAGTSAARAFLTNTQGVFRGENLTPGFYTARVTLAGFLPSLEKHIRITSNLTTVVRIELESMFASLDRLRRFPSGSGTDSDDWKWVLRSATGIRPVLEWMGDDSRTPSPGNLEIGPGATPRVRMEFTNGSRRPLSASSIAPAPATAVAYDRKLGGSGKLIFAGQVSYDQDSPGGGIATVWLPTGALDFGPHTTLVLREARLSPDGPTFRGVHLDQGGTLSLGSRVLLKYGAEYVLVGLGPAASSLRPTAEMTLHLSDNWQAAIIFASVPTSSASLDSNGPKSGPALAAAVNALDAFPALLWRNGRPVLQNGWHEEIAAERKVSARAKLQMAAFHDDNRHLAVYGHGSHLSPFNYFQNEFSDGFAYDAGASNSWGGRVAFTEKLQDNLELTAVYATGGGLSVTGRIEGSLRETLHTTNHQSLGVAINTAVPRVRTRVRAGYKWVSGPTLSRVDGFGESLYQLDPYFHVGFRQPLPKFPMGRWEALADCDNLFAQGYVTTFSRDGRTVLVPAFRTFRGGLSVQF